MIEIERKWILKSFSIQDNFEEKDKNIITQYYLKSKKGITERIRKVEKLVNDKYKTFYVYTKKEKIKGELGRKEEEFFIDKEKFEKLKRKSISYIKKIRWKKEIGDITWCLDFFEGISLILLEAEIITNEKNYRKNKKWLLKQPLNKIFKKWVIKEVTGEKEFSSKKLANKF